MSEKASVGWTFGLWWVVASTLGGAMGFAVADATLWTLAGAVGNAVYRPEAVIFAILGAVPGGVGIMQWLVLRRYIPRAGWWVLLASTLGGTLIGTIAGTISNVGSSPVGFAIVGASIGIMQWLVLRRHISHAVWWLLASPVGWGVGSLVIRAADGVVALPVPETVGFPLGFGMVGAVSGLITGFTLTWLMRGPISEVAGLTPRL